MLEGIKSLVEIAIKKRKFDEIKMKEIKSLSKTLETLNLPFDEKNLETKINHSYETPYITYHIEFARDTSNRILEEIFNMIEEYDNKSYTRLIVKLRIEPTFFYYEPKEQFDVNYRIIYDDYGNESRSFEIERKIPDKENETVITVNIEVISEPEDC